MLLMRKTLLCLPKRGQLVLTSGQKSILWRAISFTPRRLYVHDEPDSTTPTLAEIARLNEKLKKLTAEIEEIKVKYQTSLVDAEEARKETTRLVMEVKGTEIDAFVKELLELDAYIRETLRTASSKDKTDIKAVYDGLVMTESMLLKIIKKHNIKQRIETLEEYMPPDLVEFAATAKPMSTGAKVLNVVLIVGALALVIAVQMGLF